MQQCACDDTTGYRTLLELRTDLMRDLGYSSVASNPPPGMADFLDLKLRQAQTMLLRRFPSLRTERWFTWNLTAGERFYDFPENVEVQQLPTPVNAAFSTATTGGTLVPGTYYYRVSAINANGETLASAETSQVVPPGTNTNTVTVNWSAVTVPSGVSTVTGYRIYGRSIGAELLIATVGLVTTYVDTGGVTPVGALPLLNTTAACDKELDPYRITYVGIQRDTTITRMVRGIPEPVLAMEQEGWPTHFEIRQCIEVWPAPEATEGTLLVRGHFKPAAFDADADKPSIDPDIIYLHALANAKAHYRQPDAGNYVSQMEVMLQNLVAGTHAGARYIPGRDRYVDYVYVAPKPTVPFS